LDNFFIVLGLITICTFGVFLVGKKIAYTADTLANVTGLSGAFVGFLLVAMITSIPELVSTFISVSKGYYGLASGGILGSNSVNITILGIIFLIFNKKPLRIHMNSIFSFISSLLLLTFVGFIIIFNVMDDIIINQYIIILIGILIYSFIVYYSYKLNKQDHFQEESVKSNIPIRPVLFSFIYCAIGIIILSWILVLLCKRLADLPIPIYGSSLGEHFIGTLILALATSIPELATTYQIVKIGNTNMAVENISGSNVFNLIVLIIASFVAPVKDFWNYIPLNSLYTIFTIYILSLIICILGLIKASKRINMLFYIIILMIWVYSLILII